MPDHKTSCRFHSRLVKADLDDEILAEINDKLAAKGLKVKEARGAINDASTIESASLPKRTVDVDDNGDAQVRDSADPNARWAKKGKRTSFGYRAYVAVDTEAGFIETTMTRPANETDLMQFEKMVRRLPKGVEGILADKGFSSQQNRKYLNR